MDIEKCKGENMKTILEDGRKIDRIVLAGREEYRASDNYKITAYGDGRIPAARVCIHYQ
jgi:hypothetical protein